MKNGKEIVLKAAEGITFRVQEEEERIVIEAINEYSNSDCLYNYKNPKIPEGYVLLLGTWNTGLVIQNQADKSEFVWIPVGFLDNDATLDGENFNEKFGRVDWENCDSLFKEYHDKISQEFINSVKKYGGFYFARYYASNEDGKLVFKRGNMPWVNIKYQDARNLAAYYAYGSEDVASEITSGAAFDTVLRWIIKSNDKTRSQVVEDSSAWGNYLNNAYSEEKLMPTGSIPYWRACEIFDLAGNADELTSEKYVHSLQVLRGGHWADVGDDVTASYRDTFPSNKCDNPETSFRAVLYLK